MNSEMMQPLSCCGSTTTHREAFTDWKMGRTDKLSLKTFTEQISNMIIAVIQKVSHIISQQAWWIEQLLSFYFFSYTYCIGNPHVLGFLFSLSCAYSDFNVLYCNKTGKKGYRSIKGSDYHQSECHWPMLLYLLVFASPFIFLLYISSFLFLTRLRLKGTNIRLLSLCNQALHSWAEQYSSSHPAHCLCSSLVTIPHLCSFSYLSPARPLQPLYF